MIDRTKLMTRALSFAVAVLANISCATSWPATQDACLANVPACSSRCTRESSQSIVGPACATLAVQYVKEHTAALAQASDGSPKWSEHSLLYLEGATQAACLHEMPYGCEASRVVRVEMAKQAGTMASTPQASTAPAPAVGLGPSPGATAGPPARVTPPPQAWMIACARIAHVHLLNVGALRPGQTASFADLAAPSTSCLASLQSADPTVANAIVSCIQTTQEESCLAPIGGPAALTRRMR